MESISKSVINLTSSVFIFFSILARSSDPCRPATCDGPMNPVVRFPFRLKNRQPQNCGYPGFELSCNRKNQTILSLPRAGDFKISSIDYKSQALLLNDQHSCLPRRILSLNLSDSPFAGIYSRRYSFINCSTDWPNYRWSYRFVALNCLSGENFTVYAVKSILHSSQIPPSCRSIASVLIPLQWSASQFYWSWSTDLTEDLELEWSEPACSSCEIRGGFCGYKDQPGHQIGCSKSANSGLSRGAMYGIIIGVGIPGLLCLIGMLSYLYSVLKARRLSNSNLPTTVSVPRFMVRAAGLDLSTIASYPKTVLGESGRLPKPNDGTCPICLCEYLPKETLRSIPDCNHYFHADCLDEWLKLNGTCPLCRNAPLSSSMSTTSSSTPLSSSPPSTNS